jgi:hypothetical protein
VEEDVNMGTSIVPNLDSIDSFRVLTSNFDAEYGNSSGGQVLVVTKSGTAQLHGSAFEFLRNTALDARNYFSAGPRRLSAKPVRRHPRRRAVPQKNDALFGDYQGTRLTEGIDTGDIAVPSRPSAPATSAQRQSGPSPATSAALPGGSILSSELGQRTVTAGEPYASVFPTGQIPQSAWSAPAKYLLSYIPQPNAGPSPPPPPLPPPRPRPCRTTKAPSAPTGLTASGTLTAYYFLDQYSLDNPYPTGTGGASVPGFDATSNGLAQLSLARPHHHLRQQRLNEFHLSYMRNANSVGQPRGGVGPSLASQGFTGIVPLKPSTEGIENIAFNDFTLGVDTTALVQAENIYEVSDAFSRILGKHGLKAGGEVHSNQINTHPDVIFNGSFAFNGSETGLDFADFLLGAPSELHPGPGPQLLQPQPLRRRLRAGQLEAHQPAHLQLRRPLGSHSPLGRKVQPAPDPRQRRAVAGLSRRAARPGLSGRSRRAPLARARPQQLSHPARPSLVSPPQRTAGCIASPAPGQTSVRLGYGMFYTAYEGLSAGIMSANPPYGYTYTSAAPPLFASPFTVAATGADAGQRFPLQKVPYGASRSNPDASVNWAQFEPLVGIPAVDPRDVTPYAQHWMASVERQFGNTLATASYIGTGTHHLLVLEEANPADPALCLSTWLINLRPLQRAGRPHPIWPRIWQRRTAAHHRQRQLQRPRSHPEPPRPGLDLLASYTYSKSIDQSAGLPEPVNPVNPSLSRGLSAFDMRHNFVASFHLALPGPQSERLLHAMAQGWALSGIARLTTGLPVTLLNNNDTSLLGTIPNGINNNGVDTPAWSGRSLSLNTNPRTGQPVFDASQFSLPALGTMGNARRRFFSGPGLENIDATLARDVHLRDDHVVEFRAEAFNIVNHAQFFGAAAVEGNISSGTFGQAVSAMPPRLMQLALRYRF